MSEEVSVLTGVLSYKNLVHAIAGATGSVVAIMAFYPLDTARTRLQVDDHQKAEYSYIVVKDILNEEGLSGLYRGWFPVVTSVCCSNFVYFYVFNGLKMYCYSGGLKPYPSKDLLLAFIAGVANVVITTPLWVANTRLKLQGIKWKSSNDNGPAANGVGSRMGNGVRSRSSVVIGSHREEEDRRVGGDGSSPSASLVHYQGMIDALYGIARREGVRGLWSSTLPSIVLASNPAVHFMVYEALKRNLQRVLHQQELSALTYFLMGALAKMAATFVTYPVQVVQSRLRSGKGTKETMLQCFRTIIRLQGWLGLYKGLETKLTQTVAMAALMFLTYEKIASLVFRLMNLRPSVA